MEGKEETHVLSAGQLQVIHSYVSEKMGSYDPSHDVAHVKRVYSLALHLAAREGITDSNSLLLISVAALLHDVGDHKFDKDPASTQHSTFHFMTKELGLTENQAGTVQWIVEHVSYSKEVQRLREGKEVTITPELAIVQDADRLDALGAVGIARAFTYGGSVGQAMYESSPDVKRSTLGHFDEKLFRLADMMKTKEGRREALFRTRFMKSFKETFLKECSIKIIV